MKRSPKVETSGLVAGIRLTEKKISKKKFRGNSSDRSVSVRIGGDHKPQEITISEKEFGVSKEKARAIEEAVQEAMTRAIENAQKAASRLLQEELQ